MKAGDLRDLSVDELREKNKELRDEMFNVKVKKSTGQLEDQAKIGTLRKDIARIETVLREKGGAES
ncbi:50S ribosomal protein L29 [Myxococcota bacterium]|nr:50S ribosomal protein L29 [Myxococcota bacterium]